MDSLRILALADIHGNAKAVSKLIKIIKKIRDEIDLIIIAGDLPKTTPTQLMLQYMLTHPLSAFSKSNYTKYVYKDRGRRKFVHYQIESINKVLNLLKELDTPIIYTPGNVDSLEALNFMKKTSLATITMLDCAITKYENIEILGCGGSEFNNINYSQPLCDMEFFPNEYSSRINHLYSLIEHKGKKPFRILITHEPPNFFYKSSKGIIKRGSKAITEFTNKINPEICVYGHYHEYSLCIKQAGTVYINPGPLACYYYSLISIEGKEIHVQIIKMKPEIFDTTNIIYQGRMISNHNIRNFRFE